MKTLHTRSSTLAYFLMPRDVLQDTCTNVFIRGLTSLAFCCVDSCTCTNACFELTLVPCAVSGLLLKLKPCFRGSNILHSSIVSGLFATPCHSLLPLYSYIISMSGVSLFLSASGLMAGLSQLDSHRGRVH